MIIGRRRRSRGFLPVISVILVLFVGIVAFRFFLMWNTPAETPGREVLVEIPVGSTFVTASEMLKEAGVIRSLRVFVLLGKIKGLSGSIQAGELMFRTDMTPVEALDVLSRGKAFSYSITLPEGYTVRQMASLFQERGLGSADRFLALSEDVDFVRSLGVPAERLEGFLFPDTYAWPKGLTEEEIMTRMVSRFKEVFTADMRGAAERLGMSELEVVTLASIIEKETGAPEEREVVSAVFHNRLKKGYRLQTDPTVIYGIRDFDGNLTRKHLLEDHPYNTYTRDGLPPGPIANPGEDSIRAALDPEDVSYLYFVARGDGTHVFSDTLKEHNEAVRIYQLEGDRR